MAFALAVTALSASNFYLYNEVELLKSHQTAYSSLTENDVIALIDQRLNSLEQRKARELLTNLNNQLQLAPVSTPDNRRLFGNPDARITLQMFSDIECPFCRKMHNGMKQVVEHSKGTINWEFKHFPLRIK